MTHALLLPLGLIPAPIHNRILALAANHLLRGQTLAGRLAELEGKVVAVRILEPPLELRLRIRRGGLRAADDAAPDVTIQGGLDAFWELARRRTDSDTLFFQRRLSVEGETETGVHVKNLMDALEYDWEAHFRAVLPPSLAALAGGVLRRLRRRR